MIVQTNGRQVSVRGDEPTATYSGTTRTRIAAAEPADPTAAPVRVTAELRVRMAGMNPRALLGGQWTPHHREAQLAIDVLVADEPLGYGRPAHCDSELGRPLVAGLPDEFAEAVLDGLTPGEDQPGLPAGALVIDRAGHDEVDSNAFAFGHTAGLLYQALRAHATGVDLNEPILNRLAQW